MRGLFSGSDDLELSLLAFLPWCMYATTRRCKRVRRLASPSAHILAVVSVYSDPQEFSTHLMDVVYAWSQGARFVDICELTDEFEGSIIRAMRRLEVSGTGLILFCCLDM